MKTTDENPEKVIIPTREEIEKADHRQLQKMAKDARLKMKGRGITTDQYRKRLLELCETDQKDLIKKGKADKETFDTVTVKSLSVGDKFSFKTGSKVYEVLDTDEKGNQFVKNDSGTSWWMRSDSELDRKVLKK